MDMLPESVRDMIRAKQKEFNEYELKAQEQKIHDICERVPHATREAAVRALMRCRGNELEAINRLLSGEEQEEQEEPSLPLEPAPEPERQRECQTWSEARVFAHGRREKNPNSFYYRFKDAGEQHARGEWSREEHAAFIHKLKRDGSVDHHWGIFSREIPGRVGYQCANYYRKLIGLGYVQDETFEILPCLEGDARVRVGYKGGHAPCRVLNEAYPASSRAVPSASSSSSSRAAPPKKRLREDPIPKEEYLLEQKDPLTLEPMRRPMLSPYGHVLDYDTWLNVFKESKACPFTKQPLTRRDLIRLTKENVHLLSQKNGNEMPEE